MISPFDERSDGERVESAANDFRIGVWELREILVPLTSAMRELAVALVLARSTST